MKNRKALALLLALVMLLSLAACGSKTEQPAPAQTEQPAAVAEAVEPVAPKSVETDLADMSWDEILAEANGQTLTLNVYNADTQVAKYWDRIVEMGKEYGINVVIVPETGDTDARMISDWQDGAVATYDMTWGYYGYTFKAYYDAGCNWSEQGE